MTELSTLERKPLSDLHQIASQLGIEQYRKYRKPQLAELIYKTATEQAVSQQQQTVPTSVETAAPTLAPETGTNGATTNGEGATETPAATETHMDPFGEADTAIATPEEVERQCQYCVTQILACERDHVGRGMQWRAGSYGSIHHGEQGRCAD